MATINIIPDVCLYSIFDNLPIVDLLQIDTVCSRWASLQPIAFHRRRSLLLIQSKADLEMLRRPQYSTDLIDHVLKEDKTPLIVPPRIDQITLDAIKLGGELHPVITDQLVIRFPQVAHLTVVQRYVSISALEQILCLINLYGPNLRSLAIYFWYNDQMIGFDDHNDLLDIVNGLFLEINQLPELRHLTLNLDLPNLGLTLSLPILMQLRSFTIRTFGLNYQADSDLIAESLQQFAAPNQELQMIDINNPMSLGVLLQLNGSLWNKFTRLVVEDVLDSDDSGLYIVGIARFCQRFTSLNILWLNLGSLPLAELSPHLAQLSQLTHLELSIPQIPHLTVKPTPTEVPSVKLLTLMITTESHYDTVRLCLPLIFTNLQVLCWTHTSIICRDCEYAMTPGTPVESTQNLEKSKIEECMRLARIPLKQLPMLHTVNYNDGPRMPWTRKCVNIEEI